MTNDKPSDNSAADHNTEDRNVELLLRVAYDPVEPDAQFISRVEADVAQAFRQRQVQHASKRSAAMRPALTLRPRRILAWAAVAAVAAVTVGLLISLAHRADPTDRVASNSGIGNGDVAKGVTPDRPAALVRQFVGTGGLTARARPAVRDDKPVAVGTWIETRSGRRRRISLPDGSTAYVNRDTRLKIEARATSGSRGERCSLRWSGDGRVPRASGPRSSSRRPIAGCRHWAQSSPFERIPAARMCWSRRARCA